MINGEMSGGKGFTTRDVSLWGRWIWMEMGLGLGDLSSSLIPTSFKEAAIIPVFN